MDFIDSMINDEKPVGVSERIHQNRLNQKKEIIKTAFQLFATKGYYETTFEDIASELGITRAALYRYFSSKDELLFQCHEIVYKYELSIAEKLNKIKNPRDRLAKLLESHILTYFHDGQPILFPTLMSIKSLQSEYKVKIKELRKLIEESYLTCIRDWRNKYPDQLKDIEDNIIMNIILSSANATPRWWDRTEEPEMLVKKVISVLLDGIKK